MRNRAAVLAALAAVVIVVAWWFLIFSPRGDELDDARAEREAAESQTQSLRAQLARLEEIDARGPQIDAELMRLEGLVPTTPDLAGFILAADDLAALSGIDWLSITPSPPSPAPAGGPAVINMAVEIEGGFFQVLDYLNRLEDLPRLVIVDAVSIAAGGVADPTEGPVPATVGTPSLATRLTARMFTETVPAGLDLPTPPPDAAPADPAPDLDVEVAP